MAPARPQFRRLLAAVVVVVSLSAAVGTRVSSGDLTCGSTFQGDTTGSPSGEHFYALAVSTVSGVYTFSTCQGSAYDTRLRLVSDTGEQLANVDDWCGLQSRIVATLEPGSYTLVVDGYGSYNNEGSYNLTTTCGSPGPEPAPLDIDENLRGLVRDPFQATFTGFGKDYFEDKTTVLECLVKPLDHQEIAPFHVGCTRDDIWDYSGVSVRLQLDPPPSLDPTEAQRELAIKLNIKPPVWRISAIAGGRRRSRRSVAEQDGPRSILIIILNYADMAVNYTTEAQARLMMHSPSAAVRDVDELFQAMSYGRMSFPADRTTVVTVTSSNTGAGYAADSCDVGLYADHARELLRAQNGSIVPEEFQHNSFFIPDGLGNCEWSGKASVGCGPTDACVSYIRDGSASILAHELAHNVGLPHGGSDSDDNGKEEGAYGDAGSLMGDASNGWKSVNAPLRERLGYLGDGNGGDGNGAATYDMTCAAAATAQDTLTISRLDLAPVGNPHPNMVRIARYRNSDDSGDSDPIDTNYLLSFKSSADWDGGAGDAFRNKLQIHTHAGPDVHQNTLLVKTLGVGDVFVGHANRSGSPVPLNVRVVSIGTHAVTVTVNTGCVENLRGYTACGLTVSNAVERTPALNTDVGGVGVEHVWHFKLVRQMAVTFDGCASSVNTAISAISVFSVDDAGPSRNTAVARAHANEGCNTDGTPPINLFLDAGEYSVVLARPSGAAQGRVYSMTMQCPSANFRGSVGCDQTVSGDTTDPGTDRVNSASVSSGNTERLKNAFDHIWHFTLNRSMKVTFDACASRFDTHLSVLGRLEVGDDGEVIPAAHIAHADDDCAPSRRNHAGASRLVETPLSAGNYSVVIEGYGAEHQGFYSMSMTCVETTQPPTRPPTRPPTTPPTVLSAEYCPTGYSSSYSTRYNRGLGRRTIVTTHEECAERCNYYSGQEYNGGCKGYMTGMYFGLLYCRTYGGGLAEQPCAPWAVPSNPGSFSGVVGSVHPRTGQQNLGGQCCSNVTVRDPAAAARSLSSAAPPASISTGLVITITIGALVVLYAVYRGGKAYGAKNTPGAPNAPQPPPAATTNRNSVAARDNGDGAARDHGANLHSESTQC